MLEQQWECGQLAPTVVQDIMSRNGLTRPTALVLAERGIPADKIMEFLQPSLGHLGDPFLLPGVETAAARLWEAIRSGQKILVHGDYDTDGITATALMSWVLRENGADVTAFLPHRIDDGYGLTVESIRKAVAAGYNLVVTVDCGITCYEALAFAVEQGLDVIVTDHHMPGPEPLVGPVAVIDPKLPGAPEPVRGLAGVGVSFKTCHGFLKYGREHDFGGHETDLKEILDLVALGTVADIVPLLHENRILVRHGLRVLSEKRRPGINALCDIANVRTPVQTQDITYRLAPRLNAPGRMGDPNESLRLLEAESMSNAIQQARLLEQHNLARQHKEEEAIQDAEAQIAHLYPDLDKTHTLVVWKQDWHQGILGILASRLARKYNRPSIVLASDPDGLLNGSGRSVTDIDIVEALGRCSCFLHRFGGHAMAAGLSLSPEHLSAFKVDFDQVIVEMLRGRSRQVSLKIVGEVGFQELNPQFFHEFEQLEPFGHENPIPVFMTTKVKVLRVDPMGSGHVRGLVQDATGATLPFVSFNTTVESLPTTLERFAYTPQINSGGGRFQPQLKVVSFQ